MWLCNRGLYVREMSTSSSPPVTIKPNQIHRNKAATLSAKGGDDKLHCVVLFQWNQVSSNEETSTSLRAENIWRMKFKKIYFGFIWKNIWTHCCQNKIVYRYHGCCGSGEWYVPSESWSQRSLVRILHLEIGNCRYSCDWGTQYG